VTTIVAMATALAVVSVLRPSRRVPVRLAELRPAPRENAQRSEHSGLGHRLRLFVRTRCDHRRREADLRDALPDVIDLLRLAVTAGLNVHLALRVVAAEVDGVIGDALDDVLRDNDLGVRLADALDALALLGEPVRPLHMALVSAARDGAPLAASLERAADEARLHRRRHAEVRARRLPVQLLFPLVMCILPAFGLLTVVPLLAGSLGSLPV
jgi:tight adherence protein C